MGKIKGISELMVASFTAAVGDITKFEFGSQIFRKSGLDSKRKQTGEYEAKGLTHQEDGK